MADRRASLEGITSRSRHRSPASEAFSAHHESVATSSGAAQRRRPARTKANSHDTPHHSSSSSSSSIWVDTAKGESRKAKRGSESPATEPRGDSPDNTASARSSSGESEQEGNADTVQSLPNLSRISERKQSKKLRRRGGSTTSSTTDQSRAFRRRRPTEDGILGRRSIRPNHGSFQKRAETLGKLPNPSLLSILSELTQQSSASNDSNTTITQKSYDDKSYISKLKAAAKGKKREQTKKQSAETKTATMEAPQSNVFQFLNEGLSSEQFLNGVPHGGRPMTSSSTSSSAASHDTESEEEDSASDTEETVADTPMTSPTSTRRSGSERSRYREGVGTNVGVPVHRNGAGARPVHPSQSHHYEVEDAESEDGEEEEGEQSEEETDEDNNGDGSAYVADHGHAHHLALERAPPPRIPSAASSQRSDPHTRRLRRQERELANHILQSPQPHREFQFIGGASPHPYPAMPMYDTYPHSGASPPAQQTLGWPPPPPVPPPPPIGYNTPPHAPPAPYSPDNGNRFAMASHSPMAAPNMAVRVSPYHHTAVHPPQYQAQPPGTDLSRSTVVGYELLADKLSEPPKNKGKGSSTEAVVPMYRKFQSLNHRVLLHLQDEICELEEELRSLDECIVQSSPRDELGRMHPASRRGDARYGGELHYRRTELLGRVYLKLGQYNQALSSFSNLVKTLEPADTEDIQAYQAWMEKRAPIDYTESRFLDRKDDLLAVSQRRRGSAGGSGHRHSAAVGLPLILVLPLMAFAIVPGLLGRLFTIVLIGCAEVRLVTTTPELMEFMTVDEWIKCGSVYFGVMALLAALVR